MNVGPEVNMNVEPTESLLRHRRTNDEAVTQPIAINIAEIVLPVPSQPKPLRERVVAYFHYEVDRFKARNAGSVATTLLVVAFIVIVGLIFMDQDRATRNRNSAL